jgi:hypothetical protein
LRFGSVKDEETMAVEIEVYIRGKRFVAHSIEELNRVLRYFKEWR